MRRESKNGGTLRVPPFWELLSFCSQRPAGNSVFPEVQTGGETGWVASAVQGKSTIFLRC